MSWTLLGWLLIASSIAISALLIFPLRARLKLGFGQGLRGTAGTFIGAAAVFLLVSGVGAAYLGDSPEAAGSGDRRSVSQSRSGPEGAMLARLEDYARSIKTEQPASKPAASKPLGDVNTMIEQLAARLETAPNDAKGWRMLGWSYFHLARYKEAATALARAVELDPNSADLKLAYEKATAMASESDSSATASSLQTEAVGKGGDANHGDGPSVEKHARAEAKPSPAYNAAIRSDGRWPGGSSGEFSARRRGLD